MAAMAPPGMAFTPVIPACAGMTGVKAPLCKQPLRLWQPGEIIRHGLGLFRA